MPDAQTDAYVERADGYKDRSCGEFSDWEKSCDEHPEENACAELRERGEAPLEFLWDRGTFPLETLLENR